MHVVTDEVARLREMVGERAEDEMFAESSLHLSEAARSYVVEIKAARALVLAALKESKRKNAERCQLCGSLDLSLSWTEGGARTCRWCGATNHTASHDPFALFLEDEIARAGENV